MSKFEIQNNMRAFGSMLSPSSRRNTPGTFEDIPFGAAEEVVKKNCIFDDELDEDEVD